MKETPWEEQKRNRNENDNRHTSTGPDFVKDPPGAYGARQTDWNDLYDQDLTDGEPISPRAREILKLDRQGQYTVDDYNALPQDRRFELIDGVLIEMNAPSMLHQVMLWELAMQIGTCLEQHGEADCVAVFSPCDVQIDRDDYTMVQPDLYVVCGYDRVDRTVQQGAPDFIIEVLSPSNRQHDLVRKKNKYLGAGVREYWVVDPEKKVVLVYDFEKELPETLYPFSSRIEIRISEGKCSIDFEKIGHKLEKIFRDF